MHTFLDAKLLAKSLRTALAARHINITHSESLELVARQFRFDNWNILAARIDAARETPLSPSWRRYHEGQGLYRMGSDAIEPTLLHIDATPDMMPTEADFGTLMQTRDAAAYRGTTLGFSAELAGEDVDGASVWMRVDEKNGTILAFDNLFDKAGAVLSGSFGWTPLRVNLQVPEAAAGIAYGIILKGGGRLKIRSPRLTPDTAEAIAA